MANYIGLDHHQRFTQVAVVNDNDEIVLECRVANTEEALQRLVEPLKGPVSAVLEAGASWGWLYDTLERLGVTVVLANPLQVRVIAETRCKTDRRDAVALARLLRAGWIPKVYVGSREDRLRKQLWRERVWLVRMQVRLKSRIRRLLVNHHVDIPEVSDLFGKAGMTFLGALRLPGWAQKILETEMKLLNVYQEQIRTIQKEAVLATSSMPAVEYLKSLPGLGEVLAPIAALEIGDIRRFRHAGSFASYCGLAPSVHASGGVAWHGTTQHSGNHWLKWVFVEAAWVAIRSMPDLRQRFDRVKQRRGVHVAIVACARHLSEIAFALLKHQHSYHPRPLVYA
jgi:transposase